MKTQTPIRPAVALTARGAERCRELCRLERRWAYAQSSVTALEIALVLQREQMKEIQAEIDGWGDGPGDAEGAPANG